MNEKVVSAVFKAKSAKGKIVAFMDFYKNPIETEISGGCPIFNTAVEADDNYPKIKEKVAEVLRVGQQSIIAILEEGKNNGEFLTQLDSEVFALKMVAAIEGGCGDVQNYEYSQADV